MINDYTTSNQCLKYLHIYNTVPYLYFLFIRLVYSYIKRN